MMSFKRNMQRFLITIVLGTMCFCSRTTLADVILETTRITAFQTNNSNTYTSTSLPAIGQVAAGTSSVIDYSLTQSIGHAIFDFDYAGVFARGQFATMNIGGYSSVTGPFMSFTVDTPSVYEITGNFASSFRGLALSDFQRSDYSIIFDEYTNGNIGNIRHLFQHELQETVNQVSGSFDRSITVGQQLGNPNEILAGNLTGLLLPGNLYGYYVGYSAGGVGDANHTAAGNVSGSFSLSVTPVTAVPEPGSCLIVTLAMSAVALRCWLRQEKH